MNRDKMKIFSCLIFTDAETADFDASHADFLYWQNIHDKVEYLNVIFTFLQ